MQLVVILRPQAPQNGSFPLLHEDIIMKKALALLLLIGKLSHVALKLSLSQLNRRGNNDEYKYEYVEAEASKQELASAKGNNE